MTGLEITLSITVFVLLLAFLYRTDYYRRELRWTRQARSAADDERRRYITSWEGFYERIEDQQHVIRAIRAEARRWKREARNWRKRWYDADREADAWCAAGLELMQHCDEVERVAETYHAAYRNELAERLHYRALYDALKPRPDSEITMPAKRHLTSKFPKGNDPYNIITADGNNETLMHSQSFAGGRSAAQTNKRAVLRAIALDLLAEFGDERLTAVVERLKRTGHRATGSRQTGGRQVKRREAA